MTHGAESIPALREVTPFGLGKYLSAKGWVRSDDDLPHTRYSVWCYDDRFETIVPKRVEERDYLLRLGQTVRTLSVVEERSAREVIGDLIMASQGATEESSPAIVVPDNEPSVVVALRKALAEEPPRPGTHATQERQASTPPRSQPRWALVAVVGVLLLGGIAAVAYVVAQGESGPPREGQEVPKLVERSSPAPTKQAAAPTSASAEAPSKDEQAKHIERLRSEYLDGQHDATMEQKLRVLRYLAAAESDAAMKKWAQTELDHVEALADKAAEERKELVAALAKAKTRVRRESEALERARTQLDEMQRRLDALPKYSIKKRVLLKREMKAKRGEIDALESELQDARDALSEVEASAAKASISLAR